MKYYIKDGKIQNSSSITINVEGRQIFNPSHSTLLKYGYEEYVPDNNKILERAKNSKIQEIMQYDSSEDINLFYIQDIPVWLDKSTRSGLKLRFDAESASGKETTTLWYNNNSFELTLDNAIQMLYAIEIYASACYDKTQYHIAQISNLNTTEEISVYDYTKGYPDKLRF